MGLLRLTMHNCTCVFLRQQLRQVFERLTPLNRERSSSHGIGTPHHGIHLGHSPTWQAYLNRSYAGFSNHSPEASRLPFHTGP
jgi:hypothetical protein